MLDKCLYVLIMLSSVDKDTIIIIIIVQLTCKRAHSVLRLLFCRRHYSG